MNSGYSIDLHRDARRQGPISLGREMPRALTSALAIAGHHR